MRRSEDSIVTTRPDGFALILLLITVAIGLIIYVMMMRAIWPDLGEPRADVPKVWDEEWRLEPNSPERIKAQKQAAKYMKLKPVIATGVKLEGPVLLGSDTRGKVKLILSPSGKVKGTWESLYTHGNIDYSIRAQFEGVTDPTKLFEVDDKKQPELLYFISRGSYVQESLDIKTGQQSKQEGLAYVSGWLNTTLTASGEIALTRDKVGSAVYTFTTAR